MLRSRCCAINRKVAGSIPASAIGLFVDIKSFRSHYGPGVDSASIRNDYQVFLAYTVVKVLCYKSEGRWFDPSYCHWIILWHKILAIALWPWGRLSLWKKWVPAVFPVGKGGRCVRLTTLPPSCAVIMKSGNLNFLEPSGPLQACNGTDLPFFTEVGVLTCTRVFCNVVLSTQIASVRCCWSTTQQVLCSVF